MQCVHALTSVQHLREVDSVEQEVLQPEAGKRDREQGRRLRKERNGMTDFDKSVNNEKHFFKVFVTQNMRNSKCLLS